MVGLVSVLEEIAAAIVLAVLPESTTGPVFPLMTVMFASIPGCGEQ
jgi:hypothetical protein